MVISLARARASAGKAGEPIPTVFKGWEAATVQIRQSQLALFAAAPGVGKSLVSLTIGMRSGIPALYFSADTDSFTMYLRAAAMLTGWTVGDIEHNVKNGNIGSIDATLNKSQHIKFDFNPSPDLDDIDGELNAFASLYGEYPRLVVIDNLRNVFDPEGSGLVDLTGILKERAAETRAAFITLHHVTGAYDDGITPVPLSGLIDKISKVPETILTLTRNPSMEQGGVQWLNCAPVKNRTGRADPSGQTSIPLRAEMERMKLDG